MPTEHIDGHFIKLDKAMPTDHESERAKLPSWAMDVEDANLHCAKCGVLLTVNTALAWLGENGSYYCDPSTMEVCHEPKLD